MSDSGLRELLHELGSEQPAPRLDPDTYARGRRAHRRGLLGRAAAAAVVIAGAVLAVPLVDDAGPPPPAATEGAPALPSHLYAVPERLAGYVGDPLGYRWHADLLAGDLAVGTTAAVFPANGGAVVAVSALDGSYRGLELPGFDEDSYFRFESLPVALSPDGTRLAYTWNPEVISGTRRDGYQPSGVRIVDLETGRVEQVRIKEGYGVYAHDFAWSPDGRYLGYNLGVTTDRQGGVRGSRNFRLERLDVTTGERVTVRGLADTDAGPAVSDRGEVASVGNGSPATWLPGRTPMVREFEGEVGEWTAAWSDDGERIATGSWDRGWFGVGEPDGAGLLSGTVPDAPAGSMVRVLGWSGDDEVALLHSTPDDALAVTTVPTAEPRGGTGRVLVEVEPGVSLRQLSVATDLLAAPTRPAAEPDWPTDWGQALTWGGAGLALLLLGGFWWWAGRRAGD